jgi:hypothetical protein
MQLSAWDGKVQSGSSKQKALLVEASPCRSDLVDTFTITAHQETVHPYDAQVS